MQHPVDVEDVTQGSESVVLVGQIERSRKLHALSAPVAVIGDGASHPTRASVQACYGYGQAVDAPNLSHPCTCICSASATCLIAWN